MIRTELRKIAHFAKRRVSKLYCPESRKLDNRPTYVQGIHKETEPQNKKTPVVINLTCRTLSNSFHTKCCKKKTLSHKGSNSRKIFVFFAVSKCFRAFSLLKIWELQSAGKIQTGHSLDGIQIFRIHQYWVLSCIVETPPTFMMEYSISRFSAKKKSGDQKFQLEWSWCWSSRWKEFEENCFFLNKLTWPAELPWVHSCVFWRHRFTERGWEATSLELWWWWWWWWW